MSRVFEIWNSWSGRRRLAIAVGLAALLVGGAVIGYNVLKRPPDVSNPGVDFDPGQLREKQDRKPKDLTVNWPTYGLNDARTRHFPSRYVKPPFRGSDWSIQFGKLLEFSPIIVDDVIYVMDIDARFYAIDSQKGKILWKNKIGTLNATSPAYSRGRLFATNLAPGQAVALRASDGKVLWRTPLPGRSESSPVIYHNRLVIFGCECGTIFALDARTGKIRWRLETQGAVKGALALQGGTVYAGNYAGEVVAIDADSGRQEWRTLTIGGSFARGGGIYSTPTVAYGRVYFGSLDSRVYSLDQETGAIAWSKSTGAEVYSGPAVADPKGSDPTVYIGSLDGNVYALDAKTGATRWTQAAGGDVSGAGTVIGQVFYASVIGDSVGTIGLDTTTGKRVFEHEIGEYNPAITDGRRLYLTGYSNLRAFRPLTPKARRKQEAKRSEEAKIKRQRQAKRKQEAAAKRGKRK